jgi:hypothetical protein
VRTVVDDDGAPVDLADWVGVVSSSHRASSRADLYRGGAIVHEGLDVVEFSASFDRGSAIRGSASATIANQDVDLTPFGDELRLWRGLRLRPKRAYGSYLDFLTDDDGNYLTGDPDGPFLTIGDDFEVFGEDVEERTVWVSLGFFPIQTVTHDGTSLVWSVDCEDRARFIADALTEDSIEWTVADTLETKIEELVRDALPSIPFTSVYEGTTHLAPAVVHDRSSDPWSIVLESAQAVGYEAFFDSDGRFVWRPEPDLRSADPVVTFTTGTGGNIVAGSTSVTRSRRDAFNAAPVVGNNADNTAEYYAMATDDDPNSDTQYDGQFGKKPMPLDRNEQVDSQAKADASSEARLVANLGMDRTITFDAVPNPVVEPSDAAAFTHDRLGINEAVLVERQSLGGVEASMSIDARTKRTVQV